jgi:hypothetical protein
MNVVTARSTPLQAALTYGRLGWPVVPLNSPISGGCSCDRGRECASPGKHPWVRWSDGGGSTDLEQIHWWFRKRPESGVAILTGRERSGLFVVDIDIDKGGASTIAALEAERGPLPETLTATTGSGGRHYIFDYSAGSKVKQGAGDLGPGVDTRSDGGLIVAAPSLHRSGRRYAWDNWGTPPAELPAWVVERLMPAPPAPPVSLPPPSSARGNRYAEAALERTVKELLALTAVGVRNNSLNAAAYAMGRLVGAGLISPDRVGHYLLDAAITIGLGQSEAEATILSGLRAGVAQPREVPA